MIPLSVETTEAIIGIEQMVVNWLLGAVPVGVLALAVVVSLAVSWLTWAEGRSHRALRPSGAGRHGRRHRFA